MYDAASDDDDLGFAIAQRHCSNTFLKSSCSIESETFTYVEDKNAPF